MRSRRISSRSPMVISSSVVGQSGTHSATGTSASFLLGSEKELTHARQSRVEASWRVWEYVRSLVALPCGSPLRVLKVFCWDIREK